MPLSPALTGWDQTPQHGALEYIPDTPWDCQNHPKPPQLIGIYGSPWSVWVCLFYFVLMLLESMRKENSHYRVVLVLRYGQQAIVFHSACWGPWIQKNAHNAW